MTQPEMFRPPAPPDPLANIEESTINDELIRTIATFINGECLQYCLQTNVPGEILICHVVLRLSRELCLPGTLEFINSLPQFSSLMAYIAKLVMVMGPRFYERWTAVFRELHQQYVAGNTTVSVSPVRRDPHIPPSFPESVERSQPPRSTTHGGTSSPSVQAPTFRPPPFGFRTEDNVPGICKDSLSLRTVGPLLQNTNLDVNRHMMRSSDQDIINEVCRTEEDLQMLRELPQYAFLAKERKFFVRALGAVVSMGLKRKNNFRDFIQEMKSRSRETVPTSWAVNLFVATVNNPDPFTHVISLEIACYIDRQGTLNVDELQVFMLARCLRSPLDDEDRNNAILIDGWTFRMRPQVLRASYQEARNTGTRIRTGRGSGRNRGAQSFPGRGIGGAEHPDWGHGTSNDDSRKSVNGTPLNSVQLDDLLHKLLMKSPGFDWMSADFVKKRNTRALQKRLEKGRKV
eukprot:Tbor_TRINITY_DN6155_c3_g4::TRINITY_DN6155_c3_g4_i3::g.22671::m.22671